MVVTDSTHTVYVQLLNEGTPAWRPTRALLLENGLYELLSTPSYDLDDEEWEFLPNTVVRCEHRPIGLVAAQRVDLENK